MDAKNTKLESYSLRALSICRSLAKHKYKVANKIVPSSASENFLLTHIPHSPCLNCNFRIKQENPTIFLQRPDSGNLKCRITLAHTDVEAFKEIFAVSTGFLASSRKSETLDDFTYFVVATHEDKVSPKLKALTIPVKKVLDGFFGDPVRRNSKPWTCSYSGQDVTEAEAGVVLYLPLAEILEQKGYEVFFLYGPKVQPVLLNFFYNLWSSLGKSSKASLLLNEDRYREVQALLELGHFPDSTHTKNLIENFYNEVSQVQGFLETCQHYRFTFPTLTAVPPPLVPPPLSTPLPPPLVPPPLVTQEHREQPSTSSTVPPAPETLVGRMELPSFKLNEEYTTSRKYGTDGLVLFCNLIPIEVCRFFTSEASNFQRHPRSRWR